MTTACTEHVPIWAESSQAFECKNCLTTLPTATGRCSCGHLMDAHNFYRNVGTPDEPVWQEAKVPICPGGKP